MHHCFHSIAIHSLVYLFPKELKLYITFSHRVVVSQCHAAKNVGGPTHKCPPTSSDSPHNKGDAKSSTRRKNQVKVTGKTRGSHCRGKDAPEEMYRSLKNILQPSITSDHCSILPELKAAEELGRCVVDFQI